MHHKKAIIEDNTATSFDFFAIPKATDAAKSKADYQKLFALQTLIKSIYDLKLFLYLKYSLNQEKQSLLR